MFITLLTLILSFLYLFFIPDTPILGHGYLLMILLVGGSLVLLTTLALYRTLMKSAQNLEQKLIPNLGKWIREDKTLSVTRFFLFSFVLLSYGAALFTTHPLATHKLFFVGWFLLFGFALDLLNDTWKRSIHFLTPSYLVDHIINLAKADIRNDQDSKLFQNIDDLSEIALHAVEKSKLSLGTGVIKGFAPIMQLFFEASKSIGHTQKNDLVKKRNGIDETSYAIFYLFQRLELIYDKALKERLESICRQIIITIGKIITYAASYDLSLITFPTHFLVKFGLKALQHHFGEIAILTTSTLLELSKTITTEIDLTYEELKTPFQSIINGLDAIAKQTFKNDKTKPVAVLIHPLLDLKGFFQTEKMKMHQDTPTIITSIDSVLKEFEALQSVMQQIPPLPRSS